MPTLTDITAATDCTGTRAYVVRTGRAHMAARFATDFVDGYAGVAFGLLTVEDRVEPGVSSHDLTGADVFLPDPLPADAAPRPWDAPTPMSRAVIAGEPVRLGDGVFRVRLECLADLPPVDRL